MSSRIFLLFVIFFAVWALTLSRGAFLQLAPNERLDQLRKRQFEKILTLRARRGVIFDRQNREMAVSVPSYSIFLDPQLVKEPARMAQALAQPLRMNPKTIVGVLKKNRHKRFVWLRRQMSEELKIKIAKLSLPGVGFIEEPRRIYPNKTLMGQVLGFVGNDGQGLEGLEFGWNEPLIGRDQKVQVRRDARGRPLLLDGQIVSSIPDGSDLYLTIDAEIQYYLEEELNNAIREYSADRATGIILDAQTSEVIASVSLPHFDPNNPFRGAVSSRRNHVITDAFEPGSVMKTFVMAAGLKDGSVQPNSKIDCENGSYKIADRIIREAETTHKFGVITATEVLAHSSNVGVSKIALSLGAEKLRQTLVDFGFGKQLNIDLPGESTGILHALPWNNHLLANVSFGHGLAATPLQIAAAYAAIANGGKLKKPYLVKKVVHADAELTSEFKGATLAQVMTPEQANTLRLMLMAATGPDSTGFNARVAGYPVAGKTGTAQKVDFKNGGYLKDAYISSFAGFIPAQEPKYVIYISVDNPKGEYYATTVAAPVFSKVAAFSMRKAGIPPVLIEEKHLPITRKNGPKEDLQKRAITEVKKSVEDFEELSTPDLVGLSLREALSRLKGRQVRLQVRGTGRVVETIPQAGEPLPAKSLVRVILEPPRRIYSGVTN